jgi:hypothetical protein
VKGPDAGENPETEVEEEESELLLPWREDAWLHEGHNVEGIQP